MKITSARRPSPNRCTIAFTFENENAPSGLSEKKAWVAQARSLGYKGKACSLAVVHDGENPVILAGLGSRKPWEELKVEATRDVRRLVADLQAAMTLQPVQPPVPVEPAPKATPKAANDF